MRLLILAVGLACTASPALGQERRQFLQRAEQENVSNQTCLGRWYSMYDLGHVVREHDTEDGSWKPVLIGAGIGLTLGLTFSLLSTPELRCIAPVPTVDDFETGECRPTGFWNHPTTTAITTSFTWAGIGEAIGWLIRRTGEVAPD